MGRYLRVNLLGPGPRLMKKRIYWPAVSQRLRNTALEGADIAVGLFTVTNSDVSTHDLLLGVGVVETLKIGYVHIGACLPPDLKFTKTFSARKLLIPMRDIKPMPWSK